MLPSPLIVSLPAPPSAVSLPLPMFRTSLPPPDLKVSLCALPVMVSLSASTSLKKSSALLVITSSRAFANGLPNAFGRVIPLITTSGAPKLLFDRSTSI